MQSNLFASRLKQSMQDNNLKQIDLMRAAEKRGIKLGKSHVSQYVSGKTIPRDNILNVLAEVLEVDAGWLKGTDENAEKSAVAEHKNEVKASKNIDKEKSSKSKHNNLEATSMKEFRKSSKLDNVLYDVRGPVVEEAARMEEAGTHVLKLNIGNPAPFGFRAPDEVIYDMRSQLTECEGYSQSKGLFSARKAIMQYMQNKNVPNVAIEDIYTGNGVSELINLSMLALLDTGDEVLVPSPDYPLWTACVTLAGGKAVHYICDEEAEWNPDIDDIKKKITNRTKAIVIINPNNPTGMLYPREVLEKIVDVARRHELILFADEIYDRLVMDGKEHVALASLAPDLLTLCFNGLSKSHLIAGYRCGWLCLAGDKSKAKSYIEGLNLLSSMRLCSNVPAQSVIPTALDDANAAEEIILPGGRIYEQRECIWKRLNEIPGISAVKPDAAFYVFPKMDERFNIKDDEKFALDFLKEKKILITHGGGFHWETPDHFRVVYLPELDVLNESCDRMVEFFDNYKQ